MERRTPVRTAVVWETVQQALAGHLAARVVDVGGGTGGLAVRLAELGHHVTVIDPSPDALAALGRRARESEVDDRIRAEQGDLDDLLTLVGPAGCDVVLCHGVLGIVPDREAGMATLAQALAPGGLLSLLVSQRHAAVIARAMAGHFGQAAAVLNGQDEGAEHRFTMDELSALVGPHLSDYTFHGVRVFTDLVPGSLLDVESGASAALLDLERTVSTWPEYLTLATQIHVLGTR